MPGLSQGESLLQQREFRLPAHEPGRHVAPIYIDLIYIESWYEGRAAASGQRGLWPYCAGGGSGRSQSQVR
jgi:hypothetical protein